MKRICDSILFETKSVSNVEVAVSTRNKQKSICALCTIRADTRKCVTDDWMSVWFDDGEWFRADTWFRADSIRLQNSWPDINFVCDESSIKERMQRVKWVKCKTIVDEYQCSGFLVCQSVCFRSNLRCDWNCVCVCECVVCRRRLTQKLENERSTKTDRWYTNYSWSGYCE